MAPNPEDEDQSPGDGPPPAVDPDPAGTATAQVADAAREGAEGSPEEVGTGDPAGGRDEPAAPVEVVPSGDAPLPADDAGVDQPAAAGDPGTDGVGDQAAPDATVDGAEPEPAPTSATEPAPYAPTVRTSADGQPPGPVDLVDRPASSLGRRVVPALSAVVIGALVFRTLRRRRSR